VRILSTIASLIFTAQNNGVIIMSKKIKVSLAMLLLFMASTAFAGVLMSQWTEGTSRFCKYSDGEVVEISYGSTCSSTN
jgi:hypothetical protein